MGKHNIGFFNSTALIGLVQFLKHIVSAAKIGSEKGLEGAVSNSGLGKEDYVEKKISKKTPEKFGG